MLTFEELYRMVCEAREWSGNYVDIPWGKGGIPDLSGSAIARFPSQQHLCWGTPSRNYNSSQYYKSVLLDDGRLVFFKHPAKFTKENIIPKLERYLKNELGYTGELKRIFRVSPSVIDKIKKPISTMEEYEKYGAERMGERSAKMDGEGKNLARLAARVEGKKYIDPELTGGSREEINEKIKEKATMLAKELMRTLMSNGVSRENALSAAKNAYKKFLIKYRSESSLGKTSAGGVKHANTFHPIISRAGEVVKKARNINPKEAAMNMYRRLRAEGKSDAAAMREAEEYYNKLISKD